MISINRPKFAKQRLLLISFRFYCNIFSNTKKMNWLCQKQFLLQSCSVPKNEVAISRHNTMLLISHSRHNAANSKPHHDASDERIDPCIEDLAWKMGKSSKVMWSIVGKNEKYSGQKWRKYCEQKWKVFWAKVKSIQGKREKYLRVLWAAPLSETSGSVQA